MGDPPAVGRHDGGQREPVAPRCENIGYTAGGENLMESKRPNYCPNCGEALPKARNYAVPIVYGESDGGYDTYCPACGWSGDILPDSEQGVHAARGAES